MILAQKTIAFIENPAVTGRDGQYIEIEVDAAKILESWRSSVFSFEWLTPEGQIKTAAQLSDGERPKRLAIEDRLKASEPITKPVLGIGIMDNVEIGSGRAEFLTLTAYGCRSIPVHIPRSNERDFKPFLAALDS